MPAENFWITLLADFSENAVEGPGWYLYAARAGAALIPIRRISKSRVIALSQAIQDALDETDEPVPVAPGQLIDSGNTLISRAIDEQLAEAEERAKRIAKLRRLKAAENEEQETTTNDVRRTSDGDGDGRTRTDSERGWEPGRGSDDASDSAGSTLPNPAGTHAGTDGNHPYSDVAQGSSPTRSAAD